MNISHILLKISQPLRDLVERDDAEATKQSAKHDNVKRLRAQRELQFSDSETSAKAYLSGEPFQDFVSLQAQENAELRDIALIEKAREVLAREIKKAKDDAAKKYCYTLLDKEREILKRVCSAATLLHQANVEYMAIRQHLIDDEIGLFGGVGALDVVTAFGHPKNLNSDFAQFCRDAHKAGFMKSIPVEFR